MKTLIAILVTVATLTTSTSSIYDFNIKSLDGETKIKLSDYKGKKILFVNVASKCGYTSQYKDLQALHEKHGDKVTIIGLPCNQFMGQEPGDAKTIAQFCKKNYGVTFQMTEKINVKGAEQHPIYQWLTKKSYNGVGDFKVSWNFNKFLVDENGKLIQHFPSNVNPMDDQLVKRL